MREIGKMLLVVGAVIAGAGALLLFGARLPFRLGRHGSFYFPIVTCLLLSAVFTILMWIVNLFRR